MNPRVRNMLREAFETGYTRGALARDEGELFQGMPQGEIVAAIEGASAEWLAELDELDRKAVGG